MQDKVEAFVDSLNLPSSKAQPLARTLKADSNLAAFLDGKDYDTSGLISLACQSAQSWLGADSVDITPLNQTTVDANWWVVVSAQNHEKLIITIKVSNMLVFSNMCSTPGISTRCLQDAEDCHLFPNNICRP